MDCIASDAAKLEALREKQRVIVQRERRGTLMWLQHHHLLGVVTQDMLERYELDQLTYLVSGNYAAQREKFVHSLQGELRSLFDQALRHLHREFEAIGNDYLLTYDRDNSAGATLRLIGFWLPVFP
ncbi:hypothetical protein EON64_01550 [archaeon]|nr:MAG: hypothetical protein EON64_01550 [archaeon]